MKVFIIILLILVLIFWLTHPSCESKRIVIDGKEVNIPRYGAFNSSEKRDDIRYEVSIKNVIWGCLLVETIIAPIILFGWNVYEPMGKIDK